MNVSWMGSREYVYMCISWMNVSWMVSHEYVRGYLMDACVVESINKLLTTTNIKNMG